MVSLATFPLLFFFHFLLPTGMKREYFLMNVETGNVTPLFDTGKSGKNEPMVLIMPTGELALVRDETTIFVNPKDSAKAQKNSITWSDTPLDIQFSHPYMIAALPKSIEICSRNPAKPVQRIIDITGVHSLVNLPSLSPSTGKHMVQCYAASQTHIWRLVPTPIDKQIEQLIAAKDFEVALELSASIPDEEAKKKKIVQIKTLYAFSKFQSKNFEFAFKIFKEIKTEPTYVIGLYPDLLPERYRKQLDYPSEPPKFTEGDLDQGFPPLIEYLTEIRTDNLKKKNLIKESTNSQYESQKRRLQIVETSLLKSYIKTNQAMVRPLLGKDNNCHLEECERALVKAKMVKELVLLYQSKGTLFKNIGFWACSFIKNYKKSTSY